MRIGFGINYAQDLTNGVLCIKMHSSLIEIAPMPRVVSWNGTLRSFND
jgi:hypothetical protein